MVMVRTVVYQVFKLTKLEILDLNENRIGKLPALVGELRALVSLSIGSNKIEVIPNEIAVDAAAPASLRQPYHSASERYGQARVSRDPDRLTERN